MFVHSLDQDRHTLNRWSQRARLAHREELETVLGSLRGGSTLEKKSWSALPKACSSTYLLRTFDLYSAVEQPNRSAKPTPPRE